MSTAHASPLPFDPRPDASYVFWRPQKIGLGGMRNWDKKFADVPFVVRQTGDGWKPGDKDAYHSEERSEGRRMISTARDDWDRCANCNEVKAAANDLGCLLKACRHCQCNQAALPGRAEFCRR